MAYHLHELPYAPTALEPHFDEAWLASQQDWHEQYVARLNSLLAGTEWAGAPVEDLLRRLRALPDELREPVRENAGGHLNHSLLVTGLGPDGGGEPGYEFLDDIEAAFGSFPKFQAAVARACEDTAGQGWVWLVWTGSTLELASTDLEHNPLDRHQAPLLGVDLWEHAHAGFPDRAAYVHALWQVIDWRVIGERFLEAEEASRRLQAG